MGNQSKEQYALLSDYDQNTSYSKAFHTLFANICFNWEHNSSEPSHVHTLLLTSVTEYAEQATVAANLAIVAAQSGYKTLLIDADLHTTDLNQRFGLDKSAGLSELLEDPTITPQRVSEYLQPTFIPNLHILSSGDSTLEGAKLLLSPKLKACMDSIRNVLVQPENVPGIVIYHSSPIVLGVDASLIGAFTDQTLLSIVAGRTTREQAKQAREQLEQAHAKLVGAIMVQP
jgi:capsular exopolysaccharide synthesis family protein